MNDLFAPPGNNWRSVSPQLGKLRRIILSVSFAVTLVAGILVFMVFALPFGLLFLFVALVAALTAVGWVLVGRNARSWGYAEREEDLYIKHGASFRPTSTQPTAARAATSTTNR